MSGERLHWTDCPGALRDLAIAAPSGLAPLMLQAASELEYANRVVTFWKNWKPGPREPVERFLHDDVRGWIGPAIFMNGEALVREADYNSAMATVALLTGELERLRAA